MRRIQTYPDRGAKVCLPRGDTKREGSTINRRGVAVITEGVRERRVLSSDRFIYPIANRFG